MLRILNQRSIERIINITGHVHRHRQFHPPPISLPCVSFSLKRISLRRYLSWIWPWYTQFRWDKKDGRHHHRGDGRPECIIESYGSSCSCMLGILHVAVSHSTYCAIIPRPRCPFGLAILGAGWRVSLFVHPVLSVVAAPLIWIPFHPSFCPINPCFQRQTNTSTSHPLVIQRSWLLHQSQGDQRHVRV